MGLKLAQYKSRDLSVRVSHTRPVIAFHAEYRVATSTVRGNPFGDNPFGVIAFSRTLTEERGN